MKYKLINLQTKEEHICDKVTIDGFDYYVSDDKLTPKCYVFDPIGYRIAIIHIISKKGENFGAKKVIATTNTNIDIPKVVDKVEIKELAWEEAKLKFIKEEGREPNINNEKDCFVVGVLQEGIIHGYTKSQETHSNSDEDMIEFLNWIGKDGYPCIDSTKKGLWVLHPQEPKDFTPKELLQLWKEQKLKIIYYESN